MRFPPAHGDFFTFSNGNFDCAVVFFQKGQKTPVPPSGDLERTFFFELTAGETIYSFKKKLNVFFDSLLLDPWLCPPSKKSGESVGYVAFSG
jgi:hypothetical protein